MIQKLLWQNGRKKYQMKSNKIKLLSEHLTTLNYWRDQLLALERTHYNRDYEKERTCRNMINKYLDDVLDYNKNIKKNTKN